MAEIHIERFRSWDEIFPNRDEANRQYSEFLNSMMTGYDSKKTIRRTQVDPKTGLSFTTFEGNGVNTSVWRLENGNVRINFSPDSDIVVTPEVGNKTHDWTYNQLNSMREHIKELGKSAGVIARTRLVFLGIYLAGKPAAMSWEEIMVYNQRLPQRIGYRIYPADSLEDAQKLLEQG